MAGALEQIEVVTDSNGRWVTVVYEDGAREWLSEAQARVRGERYLAAASAVKSGAIPERRYQDGRVV